MFSLHLSAKAARVFEGVTWAETKPKCLRCKLYFRFQWLISHCFTCYFLNFISFYLFFITFEHWKPQSRCCPFHLQEHLNAAKTEPPVEHVKAAPPLAKAAELCYVNVGDGRQQLSARLSLFSPHCRALLRAPLALSVAKRLLFSFCPKVAQRNQQKCSGGFKSCTRSFCMFSEGRERRAEGASSAAVCLCRLREECVCVCVC